MFHFVLVLVGQLVTLVTAVEIDAVAFSLPPPPSLNGPLMSNSVLYEAERLHEGKIQTPQSYVSLGDGLYTVTSDSLVVNVAPCRPLVIANLKPRGCRGPENCGRLTSVRRSPHNKLLIVDAYRGVFEVDPLTGVTTLLYNSKRLVNGRPSTYLNDIIVLPDGTMILSDSSAHFTHAQEFWIRFEGRADGRLIGYNPLNMVAKEIMAGLAYPSGLELTHDGQAFLVAETGRARIMRVDLNARSLLRRTHFVENLPGMPEHIRQSGRGTYWVGLSYARFLGSSALDQYAMQPSSRNILAEHRTIDQLKLLFNPRGIAVELGAKGDLIGSLHDSTGLKVSEITEVRENAGVVYVGTRHQDAVIRAILPDVANGHITVTSTLQVLRSRCQVSEREVPIARQQLRQQIQVNKEPTPDDRALYNSLVPKAGQPEYSRKPVDLKKDTVLSNELTRALPKVLKESQTKASPMVSEAHQAHPQKSNRIVTKQEQHRQQQKQRPVIPLRSLERFQQRLQQQRQRQQAQHQNVRVHPASVAGARRPVTPPQNQNNSVPSQNVRQTQHQQTSDLQQQNHLPQPLSHMGKPQTFQRSSTRTQSRRVSGQTIHSRFSKPSAVRPSLKVMTYHPQLRRDSLPRRQLFQAQQPQFAGTHHFDNGHSPSTFQAMSQRHQNSINFHPPLSQNQPESTTSSGQDNQTITQQPPQNANELGTQDIQSSISTVSPIYVDQPKPTATTLSISATQTQQGQDPGSEAFSSSPTRHQNQDNSNMQQLGLFAGTQPQNVASGLPHQQPQPGQVQEALRGDQTALSSPQNNGQNSFSGQSNPMSGENIAGTQGTSTKEMSGMASDSTIQVPSSLSGFSGAFAGTSDQKEIAPDLILETNLETNVSNPSQYDTNLKPGNLDLGAYVQTVTNTNAGGGNLQQPGQMDTKVSSSQRVILPSPGNQFDSSSTNDKGILNDTMHLGPSHVDTNVLDSAFLGGFASMSDGQINGGVNSMPRPSHDLGSYGMVSSGTSQQQHVQRPTYQSSLASSGTEPGRQISNGDQIQVNGGRFPPSPGMAISGNVPIPASSPFNAKSAPSSFSSITFDQTINPPGDNGQVTIVSYADRFSGLRHNNLSLYDVLDRTKMSVNDNAGNKQLQRNSNIGASQSLQSPRHAESNTRRVNVLTRMAVNPSPNRQPSMISRDIREVQMLPPQDKLQASPESANQKAQFSQGSPNKVVLKQGLQELRNYLQSIKSNTRTGDKKIDNMPIERRSSGTASIDNSAIREQQKPQTVSELAASITENQGAPVTGFLEIKQSNGRSVRLALSQDVIRQALDQFHADGQSKLSSKSGGSSPDNTHEITTKNSSFARAVPYNPSHQSVPGLNVRRPVNQRQPDPSNIRPGPTAHSYQEPPYHYVPHSSQGLQQPPQTAPLQQPPTQGQRQQVPSPFLQSPFVQQPLPRHSMIAHPPQMPQPSNPPTFQQQNQPPVWMPPPPAMKSPPGPHFIPNGRGSQPSLQDPWQPDILNGFSPQGQAPRPQQGSFPQGVHQQGSFFTDSSHDRSLVPYSNPSGPPRPPPAGHMPW